MHVCTIIAKNYVAFARVLASSLRAVHPDARMSVLVVDDPGGHIDPADEGFELLTIDDLEIDEFAAMAARYDVIELSTAVKPWLMRRLLADSEAVVYLDPDIRVFAPLDDADRLAREHGVVLTPHLLEPIPRDGRRPGELDILQSGAYNLGFLALGRSEQADTLLDWWSERLRTDCVVDPAGGRFVDQRWIDLAPGLLSDHAVLRDPGWNVAYWNVHSRRLAHGAQGWTVEGRPLRFFHFSGFDPEEPDRLSRHQDRVRLARRPDLRELCAGYAQEVLAAGHAVAREWPYEPAGPPQARRNVGGVNVVGYLRAELGVAEAARLAVTGLRAAGVSVDPVAIEAPSHGNGHAYADARTRGRHPVTLLCVNADMVRRERLRHPLATGGRRIVGLWFWEVHPFPAELHASAFRAVDEIWTATRHMYDAIAAVSPVPVRQVRLPVAPPQPATTDRAAVGIGEEFTFLFAFDHTSVIGRKNPLGLIEAFARAFAPGDGPRLIVKAINGHLVPESAERLAREAARHPQVEVREGHVRAPEMAALLATCDAYVSLHRAEGWGLTMAEAMWFGRPVIATGWSGNLDFMDATTARLVDHELVAVGPGNAPYDAGATWAEPDLDHAAALMRELAGDPAAARALGARAAEAIRSTHGPEVAGAVLADRMREVAGAGVSSSAVVELDDEPGNGRLVAAREHLRRGGPPLDTRSRWPGGQLLRRMIVRVVRPVSVHHAAVDRELLGALETAERRVDVLETELEQTRSALERRLGALERDG